MCEDLRTKKKENESLLSELASAHQKFLDAKDAQHLNPVLEERIEELEADLAEQKTLTADLQQDLENAESLLHEVETHETQLSQKYEEKLKILEETQVALADTNQWNEFLQDSLDEKERELGDLEVLLGQVVAQRDRLFDRCCVTECRRDETEDVLLSIILCLRSRVRERIGLDEDGSWRTGYDVRAWGNDDVVDSESQSTTPSCDCEMSDRVAELGDLLDDIFRAHDEEKEAATAKEAQQRLAMEEVYACELVAVRCQHSVELDEARGEAERTWQTLCEECLAQQATLNKKHAELLTQHGNLQQECIEQRSQHKAEITILQESFQQKIARLQSTFEEQMSCIICLERVAVIAVTDCGHVVLCESCKMPKTCPLCRGKITTEVMIRPKVNCLGELM